MWIAAHLHISIAGDYSSQKEKYQGSSVNLSLNLLEN